MEEKTEAVKSEETTVGLTMNYNPFSFISCQEDALVLAGSSHMAWMQMSSRKAGTFSRPPAPCFSMRVSACSIARAAIR